MSSRLYTRYIWSTYVLVGLTTISGFFLTHIVSTASATDATAVPATINVTASCTLSSGGGNYTADMTLGANTIVANTITTSCNDSSGYAIYAIGYSGDSYTGTNTDLINSSNTSYNIKTDGSSATGSSWKMKLTAGTNATIVTDYANFHNIPATYDKVASYTSATTSGTITPTYQINISGIQPEGTYVGQVKYTLVHPNTASEPLMPLSATDCPSYSICYAPNTYDIEGSMSSIGPLAASSIAGRQTKENLKNTDDNDISSSSSSVILIAPNYKREGHGFAGWSVDYEASSTSTIYGPNETLNVDSANGGIDLSMNGLILYPAWIAKESNVTMQTFNSTNYPAYTSASNGTVIALEDERDRNVYAVAKLADGKWWMIENLRLDADYSRGASNALKAQGYAPSQTYGNFIGLADSEDSNFSNTNPPNANSLYSTDGTNNTVSIGTTDYAYNRIPRYNNNNTKLTTGATNSDDVTILEDSYKQAGNHERWYSYGNYYNWPAAIANTGYYGVTNTQVENTSVCPSGWNLPSGGAESSTHNVSGNVNTYSDFYYLGYIIMGSVSADSQIDGNNASYYDNATLNGSGLIASVAFRKYPNNFILSGYFGSSSSDGRNSTGAYWTSYTNGNFNGYYLSMSKSKVYPGTNKIVKYYGMPVRCVKGL